MKSVFTYIVFSVISLSCLAQDSEAPVMDKSRHIVMLSGAYRYNDNSEISRGGLRYQWWYNINESFGIQMGLEFINFTDDIESSFPLSIGMHYRLFDLGASTLYLQGNAGVSTEIGGDFGGFFGYAESGLQLLPVERPSFAVSLGWAQSFVFHPSHYSYLKIGVGWAF